MDTMHTTTLQNIIDVRHGLYVGQRLLDQLKDGHFGFIGFPPYILAAIKAGREWAIDLGFAAEEMSRSAIKAEREYTVDLGFAPEKAKSIDYGSPRTVSAEYLFAAHVHLLGQLQLYEFLMHMILDESERKYLTQLDKEIATAMYHTKRAVLVLTSILRSVA